MCGVIYGVLDDASSRNRNGMNDKDSNEIPFNEAGFIDKNQSDESFESNSESQEYWI